MAEDRRGHETHPSPQLPDVRIAAGLAEDEIGPQPVAVMAAGAVEQVRNVEAARAKPVPERDPERVVGALDSVGPIIHHQACDRHALTP